ncbi:bacteriocin immunity protein [Pseudomonas fontis]|uniref:Bacteriocin immunity protein n=1 Tax=Pseudomonas fontis TaxID=2942633 RepID=A0ABT5NYP0_9PSED|nr:bacteriocin immunity protein [Pseudomonas fontis]MDD0976694.1 bacteriocin immunity protein [Pseudomonas fontis]MDD0993315.1 bacteriocin immunity protein [Pseudomonas fontis]
MIASKERCEDYTFEEFKYLVAEIMSAVGGEQYQDDLIEHFMIVSEHPAGSDLIFYPQGGSDPTSDEIAQQIDLWRKENGKPGFK